MAPTREELIARAERLPPNLQKAALAALTDQHFLHSSKSGPALSNTPDPALFREHLRAELARFPWGEKLLAKWTRDLEQIAGTRRLRRPR